MRCWGGRATHRRRRGSRQATKVAGAQGTARARVAEISAGLLNFTPAANAIGNGYASYTFEVEDDEGPANGGIDLDPTPNTITVNVTPVNDAPAGANKTVSTSEDTAYAFTAADF